MFHCQFHHVPCMTALIIDYFYNHGYCSCKRCIINHKKQIISVKIWSHCIWSWRSSSLTAQTELSSSSDLSSSCLPPWSWWGFWFQITLVVIMNISHLNMYSLPSTRMGQVPKTIWTPSEFVRIWTLSEGTCVQTWLGEMMTRVLPGARSLPATCSCSSPARERIIKSPRPASQQCWGEPCFLTASAV